MLYEVHTRGRSDRDHSTTPSPRHPRTRNWCRYILLYPGVHTRSPSAWEARVSIGSVGAVVTAGSRPTEHTRRPRVIDLKLARLSRAAARAVVSSARCTPPPPHGIGTIPVVRVVAVPCARAFPHQLPPAITARQYNRVAQSQCLCMCSVVVASPLPRPTGLPRQPPRRPVGTR